MSEKNKPHKWVNIYPQGTETGDQEQKFFIALARHPKYAWRSVSTLSKESGLVSERGEEIIQKYYHKGMIFQNPKNEDQWGYWERLNPSFYDKNMPSVGVKDQNYRIDESMI